MKTKKKPTNRRTAPRKDSAVTQPFVEHLHELRRRVYYVAASIFVWGCAAYAVEHAIVNLLLEPARGQHFIYTNPGGGIDFLFRVCVYSGIILSLPLIVYNVLRFIEPLINRASRRFILWGSIVSGLLAAAGMAFGYLVGLPAALRFLLHQFHTIQIQPLVTIQSYLSFVIVYMVGSALLFQLPLILLLINRIKPLKPRRLLHYERWVILAAFVAAGLMNPSPNILSQLIIAGPFILMYQLTIGLIYVVNRPRHPASVIKLLEQDRAVQAERQSRETVPLTWQMPAPVPVQPSRRTIQTAQPRPARPVYRTINRNVRAPQPVRFMDFVSSGRTTPATET